MLIGYRIISLFILCLALGACSNCTPGVEDTSNIVPAVPSNPALLAGRQIFEKNCMSCHGEDGTAGIGGAANFKTLRADSLTMMQTVSQGRHNMPAFGEMLSGEEVQEVITYVKSLHQ